MAFAMYGVAVVVAPAIGPALGGWITDTYSWRWIFFINIPIGIISLIMTSLLVQDSEGAKKEQKKATEGGIKVDYVGFAFVAIGLGALQIVLDKGQEDDWFSSNFITVFFILTLVGIIGAIIWEMFIAKHPIVDLNLFRDRGFFFTNVMMFVTMFILLSTTQLIPQFVQEILPYNATKAGLTLMPGGFVIMALMPLVGFLVRKVQPKYLIAFGFIVTSFAMNHLGGFVPGISFRSVALARVFQAIGLAFLFVPINTLAYSDLPKGKSNNASALINLMRNLGGSVGISLATTLLARRSQVHQVRLVANLTPDSTAFQARLHSLTTRFTTHGFNSSPPRTQALATIYRSVQTQASMLSYLDIFMVLMFCTIIAAALTFFLKKSDLSKTTLAH
jgi:DHA2 family multidrug resistance protein